ncbi:MAG: peptide deformylase, partial [Pseudomonadota bacterium]
MTIKKVLMIGDLQLRQKSCEVKDYDYSLKTLIINLRETLENLQETKKIGRALAAPQIGIHKQVIFAKLPNRSIVMINPKVVWKSEELIEVWDSCFSFDVAFFIKIKRHKKIKVEYFDEMGN